MRVRLDQPPAWFSRLPDTMRAGALAKEVKRLCQDAARSDDEAEVTILLARSRDLVDELRVLLGLQ